MWRPPRSEGARNFRAPLFFALLLAAGCDPETRIEGRITVAEGQEAPDGARHTLYIAAYPTEFVVDGMPNCTAGTPVFVEFSGVENDDFDPDVGYALGGAGEAVEAHVFAWWKVGDAEQADFRCPKDGDRFGAFALNPIFPGADGGGESERDVDVRLDRTLGS